jgi:prevent-host-death family protein
MGGAGLGVKAMALPLEYDYNSHNDHSGGGGMAKEQWTVAEAKAKFSEVIDRAQRQGPQTITRHGIETVVVVSAEEWERKTKRKGNLAEFFAASPLRDSNLIVERKTDNPRKTEL